MEQQTTLPRAAEVADDDRFLGIEDLMARYDIGRSKAYDLVRDPQFPASVIPNKTWIPLRAIRVYEMALSLASTGISANEPAPVILAPPPAGTAGRPAARKAA